MLEHRIFALRQKAHRAAFSWYIRKGAVPPVLTEILEATRSVEAFVKYNPDWMNQPRAPRGQPDGGQWTGGGGGGGTTKPQQTEPRVQIVDASGQTDVISDILPRIFVPSPDGKPVNKTNIFIGGAGDESDSHIVLNSASRTQYVYGDNYYANNEQKDEINALIAALPKDRTINLIGHSWGARRAAITAVENPGRINILITIDPVGYSHPSYDTMRNSVQTWININLIGNPSHWWTSRGNILAGIGHSWNDRPDGHAHIHERVPLDHEEFDPTLLYMLQHLGWSLYQLLNSAHQIRDNNAKPKR